MRTTLLRDILQLHDHHANVDRFSSDAGGRLIRFLSSLVGGGTIGMAIASDTPSVVVALALLVGLKAICSAQNLPQAMLLAFGFGSSACGVAASWVPEALQALGSGLIQSWIAWLFLSGWTAGLGWAAISMILYTARNIRPCVSVLMVGGSVFAIETVILASPLGIPGVLLAYPLVQNAGLSQFAVVGGVPLLSALMAASAYLVVRPDALDESILSNGRCRTVIAVSAAWFTLSQVGVLVAEQARGQAATRPGSAKRLLFIQPNLPRGYRWDETMQPVVLEVLSTYTRQVLEKMEASPDVVFWPENLLTDPVDQNRELSGALIEAIRAIGVPVVTGVVLSGSPDEPDTYRNAALWIDPATGIRDVHIKGFAVPVVEATHDALLPRLLGELVGIAAQSKKVAEAESAAPLRGDFEVGILLCYEALFPHAVQERRGSDTLALINLADDSWIEGARTSRELTRISAYRAIEQRLPFIRIAHGGLSAAYDEYGREIHSAPLDQFAWFTIQVTPTAPPGAVERIAIASAFAFSGIATWFVWPYVYPHALSSRKSRRVSRTPKSTSSV